MNFKKSIAPPTQHNKNQPLRRPVHGTNCTVELGCRAGSHTVTAAAFFISAAVTAGSAFPKLIHHYLIARADPHSNYIPVTVAQAAAAVPVNRQARAQPGPLTRLRLLDTGRPGVRACTGTTVGHDPASEVGSR